MDLERKLREAEAMNRILEKQLEEENHQSKTMFYCYIFVIAAIYCFFIGNAEVDSSTSPTIEIIGQVVLSLLAGGMVTSIAAIASAIGAVTKNEKVIFSVGCIVLVVILML